jgi:hypothetical protein
MALSPVIIIAQVHGRALTSPRRQAAAWTRGLIAGVHKSPIQQFQSGMDAVMVVWTFRSGREHDVAGGLRVHLLLLPGPTASSSSCISGPTEAVRLCGAASLRACGLSPCSRWRTPRLLTRTGMADSANLAYPAHASPLFALAARHSLPDWACD